MTGELSTSVKVKVLLLNKKTENTHNQISEVPIQQMLIQIPLSLHSTTMTGLTTGEHSTSTALPNKKVKNILNQISEELTQSTLIQIPTSPASTTTTGPTTGEPSTLKTFKLMLKNIHNQTSEEPTHRTPTLIALSLPTYITIGLTIGKTMKTEQENIETITISPLTSITSSSKLMLWNILNQTSEVPTHRTLTPISLSLPTYTMIGLTTGRTTNTEQEITETITISPSTSITNSDWYKTIKHI